MSLLTRYPDWLAKVHAAADRPPARPRVPLWWQGVLIGSVEPQLPARIAPGLLAPAERDGRSGWEVPGELTPALARVAFALRDAGLAHAWRDEQLAVRGDEGRLLGTVERAVVRPLGIATLAVHLVGQSPDGRYWMQLRALDKPNDPGLWDSLMGGMVPASETVAEALARETWEEAGLRLPQLHDLAHAGTILLRGPAADGSGPGYVVERGEWFRCVVPDGVVPVNQDGEVDEFRLMAPAEVVQRLLAGEFTPDATLIMAQAGL